MMKSILGVALLSLLPFLAASGRYNAHMATLPQKFDLKLYQSGKEVLKLWNTVTSRSLSDHLFKRQTALSEVEQYLGKRKITMKRFTELQGKLDDREFLALLYYLKIRYRIEVIL